MLKNILPLQEMFIADNEGLLYGSDVFAWRDEADALIHDSLPVSDRLNHSIAVAEKMEQLAGSCSDFRASFCYVVGLLHDIGYGHPKTGHHAIDGAIFLTETKFSDIAPYVAWHSTAKYEADARGLLINFDEPYSSFVKDQLWFADFTTSPQGFDVTVHERLQEIRKRYPIGSQVIEALDNSENDMNVAFKKFL